MSNLENLLAGKYRISTNITVNNETQQYFLTSQRYYSKDQVDDDTSKVMIVNKVQEGQSWNLSTIDEFLYQLEYLTKDYDMEKWNISFNLSDENDNNIICSKQSKSVFKLVKTKDENTFLIQDALTNKYLYAKLSDENKRDSHSYYLIFSEEGSNWLFDKIKK